MEPVRELKSSNGAVEGLAVIVLVSDQVQRWFERMADDRQEGSVALARLVV